MRIILEQLKSELQEKEKGCNTSITVGISYSYCGLQNRCFCDKCQAEISALKKGISACEEILNSQQNKMTSNQGMVSNPNLTEVNRTTGWRKNDKNKT